MPAAKPGSQYDPRSDLRRGGCIEAADIEETEVQFLYRQMDKFVFMDNTTFEQYELTAEQVGDAWRYLKENLKCSMLLFNGNPITMTPPNHIELKIEFCDPGTKATRRPT